MVLNWEDRLLHCCQTASSGAGGIISTVSEDPIEVEKIVPTYSQLATFPQEIIMPLAIVNDLRLAGRRYQIVSSSQEVPIRIVDWMRGDYRYTGLLA